MAINVALLEQVMQHIEDHPEQHNQGFWLDACGTAACFAGWTCLISGWKVGVIDPMEQGTTVFSPDELIERRVDDVAVDLLGLTDDEATKLFYATNTRPMLQLMVKDLVNGGGLLRLSDYRREADIAVAGETTGSQLK